jgi:hypothetical protein
MPESTQKSMWSRVGTWFTTFYYSVFSAHGKRFDQVQQRYGFDEKGASEKGK